GAATVDVEIYGHDFDQTNLLAEKIRNTIQEQVPDARDITVSRDEDRAELKINIDKEKIAGHGSDAATISAFVYNRVAGMQAGYLKEDGEEYDIIVRLIEENRNTISDIESLSIPTAAGTIKLSEIATVEEYWTPPTIERKSRQRIVSVKITPHEISMG